MKAASHKTEIKGTGGDIVLYQAQDGRATLEVRLVQETIWLSLNQIATLFERDKSVISCHLRNIFSTSELDRKSTVAYFATVQLEGGHAVERQIECFNLDAILSVGYRVNSKRGTQFRIWATQILREHILKGYTLNEKRLQAQVARLSELQAAVDVMGRIIAEKVITGYEAEGLLAVITDYSLALQLLDQYDHQQLRFHGTSGVGRFVLPSSSGFSMPTACSTARTARSGSPITPSSP
jgi:hypothetical protein